MIAKSVPGFRNTFEGTSGTLFSAPRRFLVHPKGGTSRAKSLFSSSARKKTGHAKTSANSMPGPYIVLKNIASLHLKTMAKPRGTPRRALGHGGGFNVGSKTPSRRTD